MKHSALPIFATVSLLFSVSGVSLAAPDSPVVNDGPPPAFDKIDIDGNRRISRDEAKLERSLFIHFDAFDTDTDNHLSSREYEKYKGY